MANDSWRKKPLLVEKYGSRCFYCGREMDQSLLQVDHFIPRKLSGSNEVSNLRLACPQCNSSKWSSSFLDWSDRLITRWERATAEKEYCEAVLTKINPFIEEEDDDDA